MYLVVTVLDLDIGELLLLFLGLFLLLLFLLLGLGALSHLQLVQLVLKEDIKPCVLDE